MKGAIQAREQNVKTKRQQYMKARIVLILVTAALALTHSSINAQGRRGGNNGATKSTTSNPTVEQALLQALTGPDGEYAAQAEYAAIVAKFGQVQPYASILQCEERHIAALKSHLEMRGVSVPDNAWTGTLAAPETLKEAAEAGIAAEERNVAMYDVLLEQAKSQPDVLRVFTHLQFASREHHLTAFKAAAEKGGQLETGEFGCGMNCGAGRGQGRGGPPPWAGGAGKGAMGKGGCGGCMGAQGTCPMGGNQMGLGRGYRHGAPSNQAQ